MCDMVVKVTTPPDMRTFSVRVWVSQQRKYRELSVGATI